MALDGLLGVQRQSHLVRAEDHQHQGRRPGVHQSQGVHRSRDVRLRDRQIQGDHQGRLDHPGRYGWGAWGAELLEAGKDVTPGHPVPADEAAQRSDDCAAVLPEREEAQSMLAAVLFVA